MNRKIIKYILGFALLALIIASFYNQIFLFIMSALFIIFAMYEFRIMFKSRNINIHPFLPELTGIIAAYMFIYNINAEFVIIAGGCRVHKEQWLTGFADLLHSQNVGEFINCADSAR